MAWTKAEAKDAVALVVAELRRSERVVIQDLRNALSGGEPREIELAIWTAREAVRVEDGVDWGPLRGWPGVIERKTWKQIEGRAERQRARGHRARARATQRLSLARDMAEGADKERLARAVEREELRAAFLRRRSG